VYLAEHIHIRKRGAMKVLRPDAEGFTELASRFEREAIAGAHINHPNVASATDFGWLYDGSAFVVLEFVEGTTLRGLIARGPMAPARAASITRQIASALQACHGLGVVHRDLKPGNVMIDEERGDVVKLIDFGLARVPVERVSMRSSSSLPPLPDDPDADEPTLRNLTCKGIVFGTVTYMAPEIALGMDAIDARSDLYALGVMLYEMLSGVTPFETREPAELLLTRRTTSAPPIAMRAPGVVVPPALEAVAARLLSPAPRARYQTAREVVEALDAAMATPAAELPSDPSFRASSTLRAVPAVFTSARRLVGRRPSRLQAIVAAVAGAGVVVLAFWSFDHNVTGHARTPAVAPATDGIAETVSALNTNVRLPTPAPAPTSNATAVTLRKRFVDAHKQLSWLRAGKTLIELVDADPGELGDEKLRKRAADVAVQLDYSSGGTGTKLFDALARRGGVPGHTLLYEVIAGRGGTPAAVRAAELFLEPDVRARVIPELLIALELREAECKDKPELFERAGKEGDLRALVYLRQLRAPRCDARRGECCYHGSKKLNAAILALDKNLKR
jgi:serine/threonine-protein kinase